MQMDVRDVNKYIISYFSVRNEWQQLEPLGRPPSKRRRQACLVVEDKMFLFGGTSPFSNTNAHGIQDYVTDENLQGLDVKLMDHSDLHILDFGMFLSSYSRLVQCACDFNPFTPLKYEPPLYPFFPYNCNSNIMDSGTFRASSTSATCKMLCGNRQKENRCEDISTYFLISAFQMLEGVPLFS